MRALFHFSVEDDSHEWVDIDDDDEAAGDMNYKMVFVVNMELNMKPGKIAAQVGLLAAL